MINYDVTIETLSPVHIGSASGQLTPLEFWQDKNYIYLVDVRKFTEALFNIGMIDDFVKYVKEESSPTLDNYLRSHLNNVPTSDFVARRIKKFDHEMFSNVMPFIADQVSGETYLPASSIKGALRGAMLYYIANNSRELNIVRERINRPTKRDSRDRTPGKDLDNLLRATLAEVHNRKTPHGDWLRALRLTDAYSSQKDITEVQTVRVVSLNPKSGYHYGARNAKLNVEVVPSGIKFKCHLTYDEELCRLLAGLSRQEPPLDLQKWLEFSHNKCADILKTEREFFQLAGLDHLVQELNKIENDGANIRVGWGSGLLSLSLDLHFSKEERIKIRDIWFKSYNNFTFPKSRKVATVNDQPAHTFGWAKVTVNEIIDSER